MTEPPVILSVQDFRTKLADTLAQVQYGNTRVEVTKHGKPVAYVISPELYARFVAGGGEADATEPSK